MTDLSERDGYALAPPQENAAAADAPPDPDYEQPSPLPLRVRLSIIAALAIATWAALIFGVLLVARLFSS